jgi:S-ribosylhomocysteine lyase
MRESDKVPESFAVDHCNMSAPQVRKAGIFTGPAGERISKFDLRFVKPNAAAIPTAAMHTLEHLLATYLREHLDGVIDLSPMGCRTGFYLSLWGDVDSDAVRDALVKSLQRVVTADWDDVPGISESECGNFRDHSLFSAREYAQQVLRGLGVLL